MTVQDLKRIEATQHILQPTEGTLYSQSPIKITAIKDTLMLPLNCSHCLLLNVITPHTLSLMS